MIVSLWEFQKSQGLLRLIMDPKSLLYYKYNKDHYMLKKVMIMGGIPVLNHMSCDCVPA